MGSLPNELLDDIVDLAVALRIISASDATLVSRRWRGYQKFLFKSVKLNPFDGNIPDLDERSHLIPYIEELHVGGVFHKSDSSTLPDSNCDLPVPFTNFLCKVQNPFLMVLRDSGIQWENVSSRSRDAFLTVFQRASFRSLAVSVHESLPSWMLLHGLSVASELTVHCIGPIMLAPLESAELALRHCSLTRLVLSGNASVKRMTEFCLFQRNLARVLVKNVVHVVLECWEPETSSEPAIALYAAMLLAILASECQLEVLDLRVASSSTPPSHISVPGLQPLKTLQHLNIHFIGCSAGYADTLVSVSDGIDSILCGLPDPSRLKTLSLTVDDCRKLDPKADDYESRYHNLLECIYQQLSCPEKWPCLTSSHILININDGNFRKPTVQCGEMQIHACLSITWLLQVNTSKEDHLVSNYGNGLTS